MTVLELIKHLESLPPSATVLLGDDDLQPIITITYTFCPEEEKEYQNCVIIS